MNNAFDAVWTAIKEAEEVGKVLDSNINRMLDITQGRLRRAGIYRLRALKRELSQFNASTGKWKT